MTRSLALPRVLLLWGLAYVLLGHFGIQYGAFPGSWLTLIWLPSGIGMMMISLYGRQALPFIFAASLLVNAPYILPKTASIGLLPTLITALVSAGVDMLQPWLACLLWRGKGLGPAAGWTPALLFRFLLAILAAALLSCWVFVLMNLVFGYAPVGAGQSSVYVFAERTLMLSLTDAQGMFLVVPAAWAIHQCLAMTGTLPWQTLALVLALPLPLLLGRVQPILVSLQFVIVALLIARTRFLGAGLSVAALGLSIALLTAWGWSPIPLGSGVVAFAKWSLLILTMGTPLLLLGIVLEEIHASRQELEARVLIRTQELIQAEKMAVLGQLSAGLAHEINTPLGAIQASAGNLKANLDQMLEYLPALLPKLSSAQQSLFFELIRELTGAPRFLSVRERRELKAELSPGFESAGIDQPQKWAGLCAEMGVRPDLRPYLPILQADAGPQLSQELFKAAASLCHQLAQTGNIQLAADKAAKVSFALRYYSHQPQAIRAEETDLINGLEMMLTLYQNQLKSGIELSRDYAENLPLIKAFADELNQVWINLFHNAVQAMEGSGRLEIRVGKKSEKREGQDRPYVVVAIGDTGPGIPDEIKARIFEPFFTTKASGQGSGLGLDIVRKIVEKHDGRLHVESQPGKTVVEVWLPVA
ncbi:MAG TPA: ATP-binding protein [Candidatus Obscuribacterales bacterium]